MVKIPNLKKSGHPSSSPQPKDVILVESYNWNCNHSFGGREVCDSPVHGPRARPIYHILQVNVEEGIVPIQ